MNLLQEPWAISEAGMQLVLAVASRDKVFAEVREQALAARDGVPLENTHKVEMRGGVAVIPVTGPLFRHANLLTRVSGATSYGMLRKDLRAALEDQGVTGVLLNIDSPGGEANGVAELADAIYEARGRKPIVAYVGGAANSAAYWIASAADRIVAARTASLGSIGVIATVKSEKVEGAVDFVSSQSPFKTADLESKADRARLQKRVDDLAQVFIDTVARNRNTTPLAVQERFGKGDSMIAARAIENGLADEIGSFESTLAGMAGTSTPAQEHRMQTVLKALGLNETATEADAVAAILERDTELTASQAKVVELGEKLAAADKQAAQDRLDRMTAELDAKIKAFAVDPAERAEFLELAAESPAMFGKLLAKRQPRDPGGPVVERPVATSGETKLDAQSKAIDAELAADPTLSPAGAYARAVEKNPALFDEGNTVSEGA